jgi:hypothetical protein
MANLNRNLAAATSAFDEASSGSRFLPRLPSVNLSRVNLGLPEASPSTMRVLEIIGFALLFIVLAVILVYLKNSFLPSSSFYDNGLFSSLPESKRYWTNPPVSAGGDPPSGFYVSKDDNIAKRPALYTMMFDLNIGSSKAPGLGSYRHILHRGSDDYNQQTTAGPTQQMTGNVTSDETWEASTASAKSTGGTPLPIYMNPGIFLHPYRNDIVFFIQTEAAQASVVGYDVLYMESVALDDVPLQQWIRITLVVSGSVVDVYMNGDLYKSIILKGQPRGIPADIYGRSGPVPFYGVLMNLKIWNGALNPKQVKDAASIPIPAPITLAATNESCEAPTP